MPRIPRDRALARRNRRVGIVLLALVAGGGVGLLLGLAADQARRYLPRWLLPVLAVAVIAGLCLVYRGRWALAYAGALSDLGVGVWQPRWLVTGWVATGLCTAALLPVYRAVFRPPWEQGESPEAATPRSPRQIPDGTELGWDSEGHPSVLTDQEANTHALILGATGTGKTNVLLRITVSALRRGLPLIVIDGKGSAQVEARLKQAAGAVGRDLTIFRFNGPTHYNPLAHGGPSELRDKLIGVENWTEPHYRRAAERYLGMVLEVLATLGREPTVPEVADLLLPGHLETLGRHLTEEAAKRLYGYLDEMDHSSRSAVTGLANRLGVLVGSEAGAWLYPGEPALDLLAAVREGKAVLVRLDSLRMPGVSAQFGALLLQDLRAVAGELISAGTPEPLYLVIDEFNVLEGGQILALLNRGREAGFRCVLATQDLADIEAAGGRVLVDQVLANTNVKILLRQDVPSSAERLAGSIGKRPSLRPSYHVRDGIYTGEASLQPQEEMILPARVLQTLPPHRAVVVKKSPSLSVERVHLHPDQEAMPTKA